MRARELRIPFTRVFKHASAARAETSSIWVETLCDGDVIGHGEACPRPYVTQETIESARTFVATHNQSICRSVHSLASLRAWGEEHRGAVDANPAAWCAIELACLDALGRGTGHSLEDVLGVPPLAGSFRYTAVVGDEDPAAFHALVRRYVQLGFVDFKVKLSGDIERDRQKLSAFEPSLRERVRVRADANNVWNTADDAAAALSRLAFDWSAVEEPIRANQYRELVVLADMLGCPIVLDESFVRRAQFDDLPPDGRWVINVRVSKMGGLLRSLDVVANARRRGIGVIVGAQVGETSLLTRAGLTIAHAASDVLMAQEGAFGTHLLSSDVCDPPIMFGAGGRLDVAAFPSLDAPGLSAFAVNDPSMLV